ncbi:cytochrome c3 family protein [bacterium]|nr:cytochrome c3 family protein [bacterium]
MKPLRALPAVLIGILAMLAPAAGLASEETETCFECHADPDTERENGESVLVVPEIFEASIHGDFDCTDCHADVDPDDIPHEEQLERVACVDCHDDVELDFNVGIHGQALNRQDPLAPDCKTCHGVHDIRKSSDPEARTFKMKIPYLCGECHREGAPVAEAYEIGEHNIIDNYSQSIHGEGLFKKGLTVTATCTSCHGAHMILPHTDPRASISPRNIAKTCMQCHARIEDVHEKVIRGELWEERPGAIPACTDCHLPHKARKETIALTISDRDCMKCHDDMVTHVAETDTLSLAAVDRETLARSVHQNLPCVKCHSDIDPTLDRPCEPSGRVDCSACHAKISDEYFVSGHGQGFLRKMPEVPYCTTCHGSHGVASHKDEESPTYRAAVPTLCGECHGAGHQASDAAELSQDDALADYSTSVHGRGLTEKGLLPSAVCIDCHGSHQVLKHTDPRSTVNPRNLPATCATCHRGIYKDFVKSVHFPKDGEESDVKLPTCADCHSPHTIQETEKDGFLTEITEQCGSCHEELAESYFDTMHGKAYRLGYLGAARCSDCHGAHAILAVDDPHSTVGFRNIVQTCRKCHEDANARFTGYLTHATHHDPDKYPVLYWTYWAMTSLLVGVFSFFGLHTLMWLPRSFKAYRERKAFEQEHPHGRHYIRRFTRTQRFTHVLVIISFLSLATTGMMLKFSTQPWAVFLADLLGGVMRAGEIHRFAAVLTFLYFAIHLVSLARYKRRRRLSLRELTLGKDAMMFNFQDIKDFGATMKWFVGKGPRPQYGRWTYWEKFDYLAVFWGVAVIGLSGLMLWFPEFFTRFMPGRLINIATIIHSDEALLAVGFIFTIHFFNTHLRPEAFPMDTVVFSGVAPLDEYRRDRPREYEELKASGQLRKRMTTEAPSKRRRILIRIFGSVALGIGLVLIGLILYSVLFGYK